MQLEKQKRFIFSQNLKNMWTGKQEHYLNKFDTE